MGRFNPFIVLVQVIVLGLGFLMIIFGFATVLLGGEPQELSFDSPGGISMPEGGYVTPVYDKMTRVTVTVEADDEVEVHLYSASFRGGKIVKNQYNETVIRDEWLSAGEAAERTGTEVVLSDYTAVSNQYTVLVVEPGSSTPSDTSYRITIEASTTDPDLISMGVVLLGLFVIIAMYGHMLSRDAKDEGRDGTYPHSTGPAPPQLAPPPTVPRPPPQPPMAPPPPSMRPSLSEEETSSVQWFESTRQ